MNGPVNAAFRPSGTFLGHNLVGSEIRDLAII